MLVLSSGLQAQNTQSAPAPNTTGDQEMDGIVKEMNTKAQTDMNAFVNEVSTNCGVPKKNIDEATKTMNPGDVYMAAQVAKASNKPFEEVTKSFKANKGKGWGEIAKEMGIKPGSAEFHKMKDAMKAKGNSKGKEHGNNGKGKDHGKGNENENSGKAPGKGKK